MKAGPQLNALVAERVMGFKQFSQPPDYDGLHGGEPVLFPPGMDPVKSGYKYPPKGKVAFAALVPNYLNSIADAWPVVKELCTDGVEVQIHVDLLGTHVAVIDGEAVLADVTEKDAPYAICLAALKTKGVEL